MQNEWTAEEDEILRLCYIERSWSSRQTASALKGRSRNAVIGRAHRIFPREVGMKEQPKPVRDKDLVPKSEQQPVVLPAATFYPKVEAPYVPKPETTEVAPLHLTLFELKNSSCRWPYGEAFFTFCGHKAVAASPYCEAHTRQSKGGAPRARL